ncbi:MAG TPA: hypothetical protein VMC06_01195 [Opitutaceae bacterium]|nr:hypothetical protein [Opitutaceae bacterium]
MGKFEIRISKLETNPKPEMADKETVTPVVNPFWYSDFEIVSKFGFRISDLFCASRAARPAAPSSPAP